MTEHYGNDGSRDPQASSDSFMEPRTIPKNWDVSAFESTDPATSGGSPEQPEETTSAENDKPNEGEGTSATFDPFPQPRTVPGQWDVSDLV